MKAGFEVTVCDVVPGRAASFATETGAKAAATPAEAASSADCVVIIVPTSKQVGEAVEAMLPSLKPGMLVIDMTSGQPGRTREIAAMLEGHGVPMIDCPVSGGVPRMPEGTVTALNRAINAALADPQLRERFLIAGISPWTRPNSPADTRAFFQAELVKFKGVVERTGVKMEQ